MTTTIITSTIFDGKTWQEIHSKINKWHIDSFKIINIETLSDEFDKRVIVWFYST